MKEGLKEIVGKTVSAVAVADNETQSPHHRVFLIFSDGTYFEFYGDQINCCSGVDSGDLSRACSEAEKCGATISAVYPANAPRLSNRG